MACVTVTPGKSRSTQPDLLQRLSTRLGDYSYTEDSFKTEVAKGVGGGGGGRGRGGGGVL